MPNLAAFHPPIVHFAIALLIMGAAFRWVSLSGRASFTGPAAAVLLLLGTAAAAAAVRSGTQAHGPVERIPGARQAVVEHEEAGEWARNVFLVVAFLELVALATRRRRLDVARGALWGSAIVCVFGVGALYKAGDRGGDLVYRYAGGVGTRFTDTSDVNRLYLAGLYQKACEGGDADTCVNWAGLYLGEGLPEDLPRAAAILDRGCKSGSAMSCFNLASLHKSGQGVAKDPARASALLAESCRLGFKRACDPAVFVRPPTPEPTPLPPQIAEFQARCDRGDGESCVALGVAAIRGLGGVKPDLSRASELFGESCLRGYDPACDAFLNLRKALEGAPWDLRRVSEYYLGRLYETGRGVPRDAKRALQWYQEACNGKEPRGCEAAKRVVGPAR